MKNRMRNCREEAEKLKTDLQEAGYKTKHANKEAIDVKFNRLVPKNKETPSTPSYRLTPRRRLSWEFSLKDLKR